jgi:hypothetical protein
MTNVLSLQSTYSALVDRLREENASAILQVTGIVSFALLTVLGAQIQFRIYLWEVPITLQTAACTRADCIWDRAMAYSPSFSI